MCLQGYDGNIEIKVEKIDGPTMVRKMATEVQIMMQHKMEAIKRIMEQAENIALDHTYDRNRSEMLNDSRMVLTANKDFSGIPVNISHSSVHGPTNVSEGEPSLVNAIDWSRKLDDTFKDNYQRDPSLSWQFFGSSTGFLRQVCNLFFLASYMNLILPVVPSIQR